MSHWFIAGASRGIGLELTRQLARRGDHVTASVRAEGAREKLAATLGAEGAQVRTVMFDTREAAQIREAASAVDAPIDVLVANAGIYGPRRQSALDMDFDGVLDLFSVNSLGPLRVAQGFLPLVKRSARPRIVLMSSVLGSMALEGSFNVGYRASKAALNKIAQCLAEDLRGAGVTVVAMHPGWVRTEMGGPEAPLEVVDSAAGILAAIDALTPDDTGRFVDYRGEIIAW